MRSRCLCCQVCLCSLTVILMFCLCSGRFTHSPRAIPDPPRPENRHLKPDRAAHVPEQQSRNHHPRRQRAQSQIDRFEAAARPVDRHDRALSGSGKSSLAFDTIYAEGQRRLRRVAERLCPPVSRNDAKARCRADYDGLSPAISIEQKTTNRAIRARPSAPSPRIYDYLRLLFARIGIPYSPATGPADREPDRFADGRQGAGAARGHATLPAGRRWSGAARANTARNSPS